MRVIENYENIQESSGEFARPGNGGYILEIVIVTDVPYNAQTGKGDYLRIDYDIAQGDFKGYYTKQNERFGGGKWFANVIKSYKEKALGMFKHFTNCIEESNPGFKWYWEESTLKGKKFGAIMGREEFLTNDGQKKMATKVFYIRSIEGLKNAKVPEDKLLPDNTAGYPDMSSSMPPTAPTPTDADASFNW